MHFFKLRLVALSTAVLAACSSTEDATTTASSSSSSSSSASTTSSSGGGAGGGGGQGGGAPTPWFTRTGGDFKAFDFVGRDGAVQVIPGYVTGITITNKVHEDLCGNPTRQNMASLQIRLANYMKPLHTGTFVQSDKDIDGDFYSGLIDGDATCMGPSVGSVKGSKIVITSISPDLVGSLDFKLSDGTTLQGTFDIPVCTTEQMNMACAP